MPKLHIPVHPSHQNGVYYQPKEITSGSNDTSKFLRSPIESDNQFGDSIGGKNGKHYELCHHHLSENSKSNSKSLAQDLGFMASLVDLVNYCRLHMRLIQLHLLFHYRPMMHHINKMVPITDLIRDELNG